jgi:hypothetical protein
MNKYLLPIEKSNKNKCYIYNYCSLTLFIVFILLVITLLISLYFAVENKNNTEN